MLLDQLKADMTASLKHGDKVRLETLRFLVAGIRNAAIAKYGNAGESAMTDEDILEIIKKQVKTHRESVDAFSKAGREELAAKEKAELDILSSFLPAELTDAEIRTLLADVAAMNEPNFGLLMRAAMAKVGDRAGGARVSSILREMVSGK